jgi:hypothetical protein
MEKGAERKTHKGSLEKSPLPCITSLDTQAGPKKKEKEDKFQV